MKTTFLVVVLLGLFSLTGFIKESQNYEQITFDYFVSDILGSDFENIRSFEFKGKTEESYSTLGTYDFCLKPAGKLGSIINDVTKRSKGDVREINYKNVNGLTIRDFGSEGRNSRLFIYPSVHVADKYYVLLLFQMPKEMPVKYVFELTPDGNISRSCRMN